MLSLKKKFLFIHIPKTAGTSIARQLEPYSAEPIIAVKRPLGEASDLIHFNSAFVKDGRNIHQSLSRYKKVIDRQVFDSLFKFTIIRNPWERALSYHLGPRAKGENQSFDPDQFIITAKSMPSIRHYIGTWRIPPFFARQKWVHRALAPLLNRFLLPLDRSMDLVLRFENLDLDWKILCEKIGLAHQPLLKKNISPNKPPSRHYSYYYQKYPQLIGIIADRFKEDIEFFGYSYQSQNGL